MLSHHLIDATGLVALSLNVGALIRPGDRTLLRIGSRASALWAINSLLIGAPTAAALSALSVGRQASALALQNRPGRLKCAASTLFVGATLWSRRSRGGVRTASFRRLAHWSGRSPCFSCAAADCGSAMVLVSALWLINAVAYAAWWQIAANGLSGGATALGAWRGRRD
jgi:hypothetical protein